MLSYSFTDFLDAYGAKNPPSMRYRAGEDFGAWQRRFKTRMKDLLGPVPERGLLGTGPAVPETMAVKQSGITGRPRARHG